MAEAAAAAPPTYEGNKERTYIMIKPDGVQRGLIGKIIARFGTSSKSFRARALERCAAASLRCCTYCWCCYQWR